MKELISFSLIIPIGRDGSAEGTERIDAFIESKIWLIESNILIKASVIEKAAFKLTSFEINCLLKWGQQKSKSILNVLLNNLDNNGIIE